MGEHAEKLATLKLMKELRKSADRDEVGQSDITKLEGLIAEVADRVGEDLKQVGRTFQQYTSHDLRHCLNVLRHMGRFLPKKTREQLNALELALLVLSGLLHDTGMVVSDDKKADALKSDEFKRFLDRHADRRDALAKAEASGEEWLATVIRDALLAEYFRQLHPERVHEYIADLDVKLEFQGASFAKQLGHICESHDWGVRENRDAAHPDHAVKQLHHKEPIAGVPVNRQYIACCLRLADILDFDRSRTPASVFELVHFTEDRSWDEWNKHLAVSGWTVKEREIAFVTECAHPAYYVAVHQFLDEIDWELRDCRYLVDETPRDASKTYALHLPHAADRRGVKMADNRFVAGAFRFQLEYEDILRLLMDKSLYPDPSLFLRELLQNALDACRHKEAIWKERGFAHYKAKITVWDHSDDAEDPRIEFEDNGIGMSLEIVENYFMRVGRSYYRSNEFLAERARLEEKGLDLEACSCFGIGILSCFLVGDRFEVLTHRLGHEPLHIEVEGPNRYFVIKRPKKPSDADVIAARGSDHDGPPKRTGTKVVVHLNASVEIDASATLREVAANIDYPITIRQANRPSTEVREKAWDAVVPTLRDYEVTGDGLWGRSGKTGAAGLESVLVPSVVPFGRWACTRDLRCGQSWFWLLRGEDGSPVPLRGYLYIDDSIHVTGPPAVALKVGYSPLKLPEGVASVLGRCVRSDRLPDRLGSMVYLRDHWPTWTEAERSAVVDWFNRLEQGGKKDDWRLEPRLALSLLEGSGDWADYGPGVAYAASSAHVALCLRGITTPHGVTEPGPGKWPSTYPKMPVPGVALIDARSAVAPTPAASRLFVSLDDADCLLVPWWRGLLRHAASLVADADDPDQWLLWFGALVSRTGGWPRLISAWELDRRYLADRLPADWMIGLDALVLKGGLGEFPAHDRARLQRTNTDHPPWDREY